MPPRKGPAPPIDRPLSRAYLRAFVGWSTAYPPGQSEPNSLRLMENVHVDRNGALNVRYGLRYLSYLKAPGLVPPAHDSPGTAYNKEVVGAPELFYTNEGDPALLFAVRNSDGTVGFKVMKFTDAQGLVVSLANAGFSVPQDETTLAFTKGTQHVEYLQINNRILALSDNGEAARMFFVGGQKMAKRLKAISVPEWLDAHKPTVLHPDAAWINSRVPTTRLNRVLNPSFEVGTRFWFKDPTPTTKTIWRATRPMDSILGAYALEIESAPTRTNMEPLPLHAGSSPWFTGWIPGRGEPVLSSAPGDFFQVTPVSDTRPFLAEGPLITVGVQGDTKYRVAVDFDYDPDTHPIIAVGFYAPNGMPLGTRTLLLEGAPGRWVSEPFDSSTGATTMRLNLGGAGGDSMGSVRFKNIVVCRDGEDTTMFTGSSGPNYFWTGDPDVSASVYHPPQNIQVRSQTYAIESGVSKMAVSARIRKMQAAAATASIDLMVFTSTMENPNKEGERTLPVQSIALTETWTRYGSASASLGTGAVSTALSVTVYNAARGQKFQIDAALMEATDVATTQYFDGSTPSTAAVQHYWRGVLTNYPHEGPSTELRYATTPAIVAETPAANTLVKTGGAAANPYKMGFFYTFENEIGESAASKITEIRIQRPPSNWIWETPNANGEPSGTYTPTAELVADQLVVQIPQVVYDQAVLEGALRWNLYAFDWSDQAPVPVVAQLIETQDIYPDQATAGAAPFPYDVAGWIQVTPSRRATTDDTMLPTQENRVNSSIPPSHRNGIVAGDRMVLVGSPAQPSTISWSSSAPGRYTMFTPNRGGGAKTLTSGNLNLPYAVVLWQNPQSIDTLAILCSDDNGRSTSYYMSPAQVQAGNTGLTSVMGFEETTSTPGTVAPFGAEVLNNALYRPLDRFLLKSTASNYNINHKTQTDKIANSWRLLESRQWIMSAQLDNRLFYLVHNPRGELLEQGCKGNEVWLYDITSENGTWSRLLVQGSALKPISIGAQTYMAISRPDGVYYFDEQLLVDDYVDYQGIVRQRPIPWMFETNTQGANKAHDAWAHLQQVGIVLGNFQGSLEYGIRGWSLNGKRVDVSKIATDNGDAPPAEQKWDIEDVLMVRRDMKEWYFRASSLDGVAGTGQIGVVQYRYTPVSVNVGYEFGSIETFEYGADAGSDGTAYSRNGIPLPMIDYARP